MHRDELAFLPAALEVQQTPPPLASRCILWFILLFFSIAIAWAVLGKIDIVVVAAGKIIPSARVKSIQALEIGVIRAIHVQEGQQVTVGDLLLSLDATDSSADRSRIHQDLEQARQVRDRLLLLAQYIQQLQQGVAVGHLDTNTEAYPTFTGGLAEPRLPSDLQAALLRSQIAKLAGDLAEFDHQRNQLIAQQRSAKIAIASLVAVLPIIEQRTKAAMSLHAKRLAAQDSYLQLEMQRLEQTHELSLQRHKLNELDLALERTANAKATLLAELESEVLNQLSNQYHQIAQLTQERLKSQHREQLRALTTPITGVVQNLAVHTVGGVVKPAEVLMNIVPTAQTIEVEAWLQNKDIGFVQPGQLAEVKIDAFPFTKYGVVNAQVHKLSYDAVVSEGLGLVFGALIRLDQHSIDIGGAAFQLIPGMSSMVEIKTGQRRIIEYFLSPILQYGHEAIRER